VRILVIDNYDSFVFNLVQYLGQLGAECVVVRNDEIEVTEADKFDGVLISPGPGTPEEAGISMEMIRYCAEQKIPLFGVCLGHQAIAAVYGGIVSRAPELLHGKTSKVHHKQVGVFKEIPSPFTATRYHSLAVERDTVSDEIEITGETENGIVMGLKHKSLPIEGVQFHPESVLTEHGHAMLANWLAECGDKDAPNRAKGLSPVKTNLAY
jgi:para-aminobenzoate synthetase component 2